MPTRTTHESGTLSRVDLASPDLPARDIPASRSAVLNDHMGAMVAVIALAVG